MNFVFLQEIPIKMVAAGAEHSVAITKDGNLYGWGWGRYGNLEFLKTGRCMIHLGS